MEHLNPAEVQQLRTDVKDMKGKVDKMFYALMGNEIAKDGGLVARIERLENGFEKFEEAVQKQGERTIKLEVYQKVLWGSVGGAIGIFFAYIIQVIIK